VRGKQPGEELHDTGVGIQHGEWLPVGFAPTPKNEPLSFCYNHLIVQL
jgi:hypothetical protein